MIEVEVKARVDDPGQVEKSVIALGAAPVGIENHTDTYYNMPYRDFKQTDEALRIRAKNGEYFLTYKGPKLDMISKTRKEFEVKINDAYEMGEVLTSLGFYPVATIVKKRKKYRLGDFSIDLDEVRDLGNFIEIEMAAKNSRNHEKKVESIFKLIEKLGMSRESTIRSSYLEMVLEKNKKEDKQW